MNQNIKVIIADDHPIFRKGLKDIMKYEPDIEVLAEANNGTEAIRLLEQKQTDIIILDIEMPVKTGLEVAQYIFEKHIPVKIIILTMYKDAKIFDQAIKYGIKGYLLKENAIDEVIRSIKRVHENQMYISPLLSDHLLNRIQDLESGRSQPTFIDELTKQELNILRMIAAQKTSREIADTLFISTKTVENHRSNICKKLNLKGTHSLLKFAIEHQNEL